MDPLLRRSLNGSVAIAVFVSFIAGFSGAIEKRGVRDVKIWLPGTQPGQADTASSLESCLGCHEAQVREWSGSMMAHAPRDPLFNALLAVTTKYTEPMGLDVGEYCLRCHSGSGWLAGRSHPGSVAGLYGSDLDGVNCDFCHRMADPLGDDTSAIVGGEVPGYGNAMYVVQKSQLPVRGARGTAHPYTPTRPDSFYRQGEFCGVCHEVSNPYLDPDPEHTPPHVQFPLERTYSEWKLSVYSSRGEAGSCQACHMKRRPGVATSFPPFRYRLDVARHDLTGGNTFAPRATMDWWSDVDSAALMAGVERSTELLRGAASLDVSAGRSGDSVIALVRVVNRTGHKLPTGFPEGRRLAISVLGVDRRGGVVFESGRYDSMSGEFLHDPQAKVYETVSGMSPAWASALGLRPGPSFLAALNDTVLFDNRIPPEGFSNRLFAERRCAPVASEYRDGQFWDVTEYRMGGEVETVRVALNYQSAGRDFVEFLRRENTGNPYDWNSWGEKVHASWIKYGGPVVIGETVSAVAANEPALPGVEPASIPLEVRLAQNYPNPFNGTTVIEFWLSEEMETELSIFNTAGQEIATPVRGNLPAGSHRAEIEAAGLASGLYFYRVSAGGMQAVKKFVVMR